VKKVSKHFFLRKIAKIYIVGTIKFDLKKFYLNFGKEKEFQFLSWDRQNLGLGHRRAIEKLQQDIALIACISCLK